jgi:hypothetical protein
MFKKKISIILVIALLAMCSIDGVSSHSVDANKIHFESARGYTTYFNVNFGDINDKDIPLLAEHLGRCSCNQNIDEIGKNKINHGACYMHIKMKPFCAGFDWYTIDAPIQAAWIDCSGCLGSTADLSWDLADGTHGTHDW